MGYYKDLMAYQKAYDLAIDIFKISKSFPKEELFAITNQIRRSSRSVCANLAEAYRRREYKQYLLSKLNDCITENSETQVWLDFCKDLEYISSKQWEELSKKNEEIGRLLYYMSRYPEKFQGTIKP